MAALGQRIMQKWLGDVYTDHANGVYITDIKLSKRDSRLIVEGIAPLAGIKRASMISFVPELRAEKDRSRLTDSLVKAINGMTGLIDAVDSGQVALRPYFLTQTNMEMALFAQRFGFTIVDRDKNPSKTRIFRRRKDVLVVGNFTDMKARFEEFAESTTYRRVQKRARRYETVFIR